MNNKLLITAISVALMGTVGMATNTAHAAPKNPTAIEASCKNNAEKKEWCQSEEAAPNENENGDSEDSEEVTESEENTSESEEENSESEIEEENTSESEEENSEGETEEENASESEEENSEAETTDAENTDGTEVTPESENTPPTDEEIEAILKQAEEQGILEDSDALIILLAENGILSENLTEEQKEALPITWDLPVPPPVEEGESEEAEEGESEEAEEGESEEAEEGESEEGVTESLEPEDVDESTFSEAISEQEEQQIQTQLETVDEVVVLDEEGNEIVVPVAEKEVIGEVLIPRDEDEGSANAMIDGVLLDVEVTFGVAEATIVNSVEANEEESVILTTVTGLEMNAPTETTQKEVNTDNLITLQADENGNYTLYLPELKVGDLVVNVKLRALTETLDTYQVEEVTVDPEDVFGAEAQEAEEEAQQEVQEAEEEAQQEAQEAEEEAQQAEAESESQRAELEGI